MKIGVVNDMAMACEALRRTVQSVPEHQVVWTAHDGDEAVQLARQDPVDLILMDLIMPRLDGAAATKEIMQQKPCAILVVTATVSGNMSKVYDAMSAGALDAVDTPVLGPDGNVRGGQAMLDKIATLAKLIKPSTSSDSRPGLPAGLAAARTSFGQHPLIAIGSSTGGPKALAEVLGPIPPDFPASFVIVQHVDAAFAPGLASWLGQQTKLKVSVADEGSRPTPGCVLVASTNDHLVMHRDGSLGYTADPRDCWYRPSVDVFYSTIGEHCADPGIAVLLTGMGRDGAQGLLALRELGWHTIAQDQQSSVVWGMPKAAAELGAARQILPPPRIASSLIARVTGRAAQSPAG